MKQTRKKLSVISPCFNEESVIEAFMAETLKELGKLDEEKYEYEFIVVDDGSRDGSLDIIKRVAGDDPRIRYISFSRNFGKESAMLAGLRYATGDCAVIMECDLQHPPYLIHKMLRRYEEGFDQVIGKRSRLGEPTQRKVLTRLYYWLANKFVDVEVVDGAGDFRLLSRPAIDAVLSLKEANRFSKGLFSWIGFKQTYIEYENRQRPNGESKWSFGRLLRYGIDGVLSFNVQPLRICIYSGLVLILLCLLYIAILFTRILAYGIDVPGYFTTVCIVSIVGGVQLISAGIIGEYVGRIYAEVKNRPGYIIEETNAEKNNMADKNVNNVE